MTDYRDYLPKNTLRSREAIEWAITYSYNSPDRTSPRVLLIGDSIVQQNHHCVREILEPEINVTYWSSSKCITHPDYLRELDFILDGGKFDVITINNGLHSLGTDAADWEYAYRRVLQFIKAKKPDAKLVAVLTTPCPSHSNVVTKLNELTLKTAEAENVITLDLYTPMMELGLDKMVDGFHWNGEGQYTQGKIISEAVRNILK